MYCKFLYILTSKDVREAANTNAAAVVVNNDDDDKDNNTLPLIYSYPSLSISQSIPLTISIPVLSL